MRTFKAKPGSQISDADANILGPIIEAMSGATGIRPEQLVNAGRDVFSVLHPFFEWDDGVAGEKYRVAQAAKLLRSVITLEIRADGETVPIRSFHLVHPDKNQDVFGDDESDAPVQGVYMSIEIVSRDEALRREVTGRAEKELESWIARYAPFPELSALVGPVKALLSKHQVKEPKAS